HRQSCVTAISHSASVMTRLEAQMISSTGATIAGVTTDSRERGFGAGRRRDRSVWGREIMTCLIIHL
ncbi:hypothetical protein KUCAC02_015585, partial [Chaenocephalus aceratus]